MNNCDKPICDPCVTEVEPICKNPSYPTPAEPIDPVSWCGFGYTYTFNGVTIARTGTPLPDGTYTSFTVSGGCVVEVGQAPVPAYTPSDCCEPAGGDSGDGGVVDIDVSNLPCNLISVQPDGLFAGLTVQAGSGVTVSGCGTSTSPLVISATSSGGGGSTYTASTTSGNLATVNNTTNTIGAFLYTTAGDGVTITGTGAFGNPLNVSMDMDSVVSQVSSPLGSINITAGVPGAYTFDLPLAESGTYDSTYIMTYDGYGKLIDAEPIAEVFTGDFEILVPNAAPPTPPALTSGNYKITYNKYGIVTGVVLIP